MKTKRKPMRLFDWYGHTTESRERPMVALVFLLTFVLKNTKNTTMNQSYTDALVTICNMRLLFCTKQELGEYIGFSLTQNTIRKLKPDFQQRAVFHELANEFEELTNGDLPLDDIIDKYELASDMAMKGKSDDEWIFNWLDESEDPLLAVLVMLMVKGWIPKYGSRPGDVSNLWQDFEAMFELLDRYTKRCPLLKELPFVQRVRQLIDEYEDDGGISLRCRAVMIHAAWLIISRYKAYQHPDRLYLLGKQLGLKGDLDIKGYWTDKDNSGFWYIDMADTDAYDATYYYKKDKGLRSIQYTISFIENHLEAMMVHPIFSKKLLEEGYIDTDTIGNFECELNDDSQPTTITLTQYTNHELLPDKVDITRIEDQEMIDDIEEELKHREVKADFQDCQYEFLICLHSITHDAVYVECGDNMLYRIPKDKNPEFRNASMNDKIGLVTLGDKLYIVYDNVMKYIDATDENKLLIDYGIEIVKR